MNDVMFGSRRGNCHEIVRTTVLSITNYLCDGLT